jgi:small subunit ribosomal protein S16
LTRVGATKQPTYRFVVSDSRNARDGRSIDTLGHYNPRTDPIEINIDEDKARDWISRGAKPSDTVARLFRRAGVLPEDHRAPTSVKAPKSAKATKAATRAAKQEATPAAGAEAPFDADAEASTEATAEATADASTDAADEVAVEA